MVGKGCHSLPRRRRARFERRADLELGLPDPNTAAALPPARPGPAPRRPESPPPPRATSRPADARPDRSSAPPRPGSAPPTRSASRTVSDVRLDAQAARRAGRQHPRRAAPTRCADRSPPSPRRLLRRRLRGVAEVGDQDRRRLPGPAAAAAEPVKPVRYRMLGRWVTSSPSSPSRSERHSQRRLPLRTPVRRHAAGPSSAWRARR